MAPQRNKGLIAAAGPAGEVRFLPLSVAPSLFPFFLLWEWLSNTMLRRQTETFKDAFPHLLHIPSSGTYHQVTYLQGRHV